MSCKSRLREFNPPRGGGGRRPTGQKARKVPLRSSPPPQSEIHCRLETSYPVHMLASRHFQRRQRAACLTSRTGYPSPPPRWCLNPAIDPKLAACPFPFSSQLRCGSRWTLVEALPASCLACSAAGRRRGRRRAGKDT